MTGTTVMQSHIRRSETVTGGRDDITVITPPITVPITHPKE